MYFMPQAFAFFTLLKKPIVVVTILLVLLILCVDLLEYYFGINEKRFFILPVFLFVYGILIDLLSWVNRNVSVIGLFISPVVSFYVAKYAINRQINHDAEKYNDEKQNLKELRERDELNKRNIRITQSVNKLVFYADSMFGDLYDFYSQMQEVLNSDPVQRFTGVEKFNVIHKKYDYEDAVLNLFEFLKKLDRDDRWSNLGEIHRVFDLANYLYSVIDEVNASKTRYLNYAGKLDGSVSGNKIIFSSDNLEGYGYANLYGDILLNERMLVMYYSVLNGLYDFITEISETTYELFPDMDKKEYPMSKISFLEKVVIKYREPVFETKHVHLFNVSKEKFYRSIGLNVK